MERRAVIALLVAASLAAGITGCASGTEGTDTTTEVSTTITTEASTETTTETSTEESTASTEASTEEETEVSEDQKVLDTMASMVGMTEEEAADLLGGGKEALASDGTTVVGRTYTVSLFGEEVEMATLTDTSGKITIVTMQLGDPDASVYEPKIEAIYGKPTSTSDKDSESGSTWEDWEFDNCTMRLYQSYQLAALEFQPKEEAEDPETTETSTEASTGETTEAATEASTEETTEETAAETAAAAAEETTE